MESLRDAICLIKLLSAGEVGLDLDADHMVCDLVTWERMVQRLGRVNRRAEPGVADVEVVPVWSDKQDDATRIADRGAAGSVAGPARTVAGT